MMALVPIKVHKQQGANGVAGAAEYHDYFGSALAR